MCIICNCGEEAGDRFLGAFQQSQESMKAAADAMLMASKEARTPEQRRQYDRTHKAMVRLTREWNALEQLREASHG